mmetsp:Transcript_100902/g.261140  ORF Transcript_100902/g.261140 Transcript_100902/m.261140 type:complete len:276 (+) Transcript_100902:627-1454(+)
MPDVRLLLERAYAAQDKAEDHSVSFCRASILLRIRTHPSNSIRSSCNSSSTRDAEAPFDFGGWSSSSVRKSHRRSLAATSSGSSKWALCPQAPITTSLNVLSTTPPYALAASLTPRQASTHASVTKSCCPRMLSNGAPPVASQYIAATSDRSNCQLCRVADLRSSHCPPTVAPCEVEPTYQNQPANGPQRWPPRPGKASEYASVRQAGCGLRPQMCRNQKERATSSASSDVLDKAVSVCRMRRRASEHNTMVELATPNKQMDLNVGKSLFAAPVW